MYRILEANHLRSKTATVVKWIYFFFVETRFPLAIGPCKSTIYTFLSLDCVVLTALNMLDLPLFMVRVANLAATSPPSTV